jgi:hypothetical protein
MLARNYSLSQADIEWGYRADKLRVRIYPFL